MNKHLKALEWNGIANAIQLLRHYETLGILASDERMAIENNLVLFQKYLLTWIESDGNIKWSEVKARSKEQQK